MHIEHHTRKDFRHLEGEFYLDDTVTFWEYSAELEKLIHLVKYQNRQKLGRILGGLASENFERELSLLLADQIIPVPLHSLRQRERGYNQSRIYAEKISERTGIPVFTKVMERIRYTETQTHLSASERQVNVRNAFRIKHPSLIKDKSILLIDDVITSGATINSCARVCKEAGVKSVIGIGMTRPELG